MNTSDSVYGVKQVRPLADVPPEERARLPRYQDSPGEKQTAINTVGNTYDCMESNDDPEITQELPAERYFAVVGKDGRYRAVPVASFLVFSDGSFFAADEEGEDLAELDNFRGFVFSDGRGMLKSERVEKLLKETKIN